jgi:hypothetical protein
LSSGKAVAGTVGDGSAPAVLLCDVPSRTCSTAGMGISPAALPFTVFQQSGVPGNPLLGAFGGNTSAAYFLSNDGGATWNRVTTLPTYTFYKPTFATSGTTTFAATDHGLMKSTDGGATFSVITVVPGNPNTIFTGVAASGSDVYAAPNFGAKIFHSPDGGNTWAPTGQANLNLTGSVWVYGIAVTPNAVWAATNQGVMRSGDKGATWQSYNAGLSNLNIAKVVASGGGTSNAYAAPASPAAYPNGGTIPWGESNAVFRSADNGATWQPGPGSANAPNVGLAGATFYDVAALPGTSTILATGMFGVYRSTDGGQTWPTAKPTLVASLAVSGATAYGLGVTYSAPLGNAGTLYRSTDAGVTWTQVGSPFAVTGLPQHPPNSGSLVVNGSTFAVAVGAGVYRSTDGGNTWTAGAKIPGAAPPQIARLAFASNMLWAADRTGGLWRSGDAGGTWTASGGGIPASSSVNDVLQVGAQLLVASSAGVYASSDNGSTFEILRDDLAGLNATALVVTGPNLVVGTAGKGIVTVALQATVKRLVPIVLDVNGAAHYTSDLSLANRGTTDAPVTLLYTSSLGSGTGTVNDTVRAGSQLHVPDVIAYLRNKGLAIPADGSAQAGTLLVSFSSLSDPTAAAAVARTTAATLAPQPVGAAGLAYSAVDPANGSTGSVTVYGLRSNSTDRSNLAVYNTSSDPVTYSVMLFSGDGSGNSSPIAAQDALPPWGWKQYNRVLDGPGYANGWAVVARTSTTGTLGSYGVVNDNATNDGSFVEEAPEGAHLPYLNVPVLVETSAFLSELILTNASASPGTFTLTYTEGLSPASGPGGRGNLVLPPHTQRIIPNAIAYLRTLGVGVGAAGGSYAGSLNIEVSGAAPGLIYAGARTGSQSPAGGQFGLFTPAAFPGTEATAVSYVYGLRADADDRSNVAAANIATDPDAGPVTLLVEAFDGDAGGALKGSATLTLAPGEWGQLGGFLADKGVSNGWVRVTRTSGTAPWIAYGVVNDGGQPGQRTGDGAYVPMTVP